MNSNSLGRLPSVQKLAYGVGHVYNDLCGTMWFTYVLVYFQFVMKLPASTAGVILMVGQLVEAVATPITGVESDRMKGIRNYGRRKSTHAFGTVLTTIAFPMVFISLPGFDKATPEALLVYYVPLVFIFKVGWAMVQVSHLSLIPELSSDANDRDDMTILRYIFDMASDMSVYFVTWAVLIAKGGSDSVTIDDTDAWRFRNIVLILVTIGLVFAGIFHVFTKELAVQNNQMTEMADRHSEPKNITPSIVKMRWKDWFREKHYFQVGMLVVLSRLFLNLNQAFMPLFLQEGIRAPQEYLAIIPGVSQLSALLSSLLVKLVLHYSTKKVAFMLGSGLAFSGCIWLGYDSPEAVRTGNIFPLACLLGAGTGMLIVISTSLVSDLIGDNTESGAYVFGSIAFIHNLLSGVVVFLIQMGHGFCEICPTYYRSFLTHGLSSLAAISLFLVLFLDTESVGKRMSERNTFEGRESQKFAKSTKKYGSLKKGFPILERPEEN